MSINSPSSRFGARIGIEPSYGAGATLTDDDYVLLQAPTIVEEDWTDAGDVGIDPRSGGPLERNRKSGYGAMSPVAVRLRGNRDLKSGPPLDAHKLLLASGGRIVETTKPGTWFYEFLPIVQTSLAMQIFTHGKRFDMNGCYVPEFTLEANDVGISKLATMVVGRVDTIVDADPPLPTTYPIHNPRPVLADGIGVPMNGVLGDWSPRVRAFKLTYRRPYSRIPAANSLTGHEGYHLGGISTATVSLMVESCDLNEFNPFIHFAMGTTFTLKQSFFTDDTWWYFLAEKVQIAGIKKVVERGATYWQLDIQLQNKSLATSPFWLWCSTITPTD